MANLKTTEGTLFKSRLPASDPEDLVRLAELQTMLAGKADTGFIPANNHAALTLATSQSLEWSLNGQELTAEARLAEHGGLQSTAAGLGIVFGAGPFDVAPGAHVHANDHVAATADPAQSDSVTMTVDADQLISAVVKLATASGLKIVGGVGGGLAADLGITSTSVAAGNHTHAAATPSVAGFLSALDKAKLDSLSTDNIYIESIDNTKTIELTVDGGQLTAVAVLGPGLQEGTTSGIEVDFTAVAAFNHTHDIATIVADGLLSAADKTKLDGLINSVDVTIAAGSASLSLTLAGQELDGEVRVSAGGGLGIVPGGLSAIFGTGVTDIAPGNHVHANDHVIATANPTQTDSIAVTVTAGQLISAAIALATGSGLKVVTGSGGGLSANIGTIAGTVAAGNHTHALASGSTDGLLTADLWSKLNSLPLTAEAVLTFSNSTSIDLTRTDDDIVATVRVGAGLTASATALQVDFGEGAAQVAAGNHVHPDATISTAGMLTALDKTKLDALLTATDNDARYLMLAGSATNVQTLATTLAITGGDATTPSLTTDFDAWVKAKLYVGPTADAFLYRDAEGVIKTDTALTVVGALTIGALKFGALAAAPATPGTPAAWVAVQVEGDAGDYRLPLYI